PKLGRCPCTQEQPRQQRIRWPGWSKPEQRSQSRKGGHRPPGERSGKHEPNEPGWRIRSNLNSQRPGERPPKQDELPRRSELAPHQKRKLLIGQRLILRIRNSTSSDAEFTQLSREGTVQLGRAIQSGKYHHLRHVTFGP